MTSFQSDYLIYVVHVIAWGSFGLTRLILQRRDQHQAKAPTVTSTAPQSAPFSRALVGFHGAGFGVLYFGLGQAVIGAHVPRLFPFQRTMGALVILSGAYLMCWALVFFRSWRFRAKLEVGHELATGGPFALVRHPIYSGINLLALGTVLWVPTAIEFVGAFLLILGSDFRGRTEEKLLTEAFGDTYRVYTRKTKRSIPGIY